MLNAACSVCEFKYVIASLEWFEASTFSRHKVEIDACYSKCFTIVTLHEFTFKLTHLKKKQLLRVFSKILGTA